MKRAIGITRVSDAKSLGRKITDKANARRPVYMVLRHEGVGPRTAVRALYEAGLNPSTYSIECGRILPGVIEGIISELEDAVKRRDISQ